MFKSELHRRLDLLLHYGSARYALTPSGHDCTHSDGEEQRIPNIVTEAQPTVVLDQIIRQLNLIRGR